MLTSVDLLIGFWIGLTLLIALVLLLISSLVKIRLWYLLVLISFPFWAKWILAQPEASPPFWFYGLPVLWVIFTLWLAFPKTSGLETPTQPGEPRTTVESLRGPAGTLEALRIYFTLVFLVSAIGLLFFRMVTSFSAD